MQFKGNMVVCLDCGMSYPFPLDAVLSNKEWGMLGVKTEDILCANCIVKRASKLPGITRVDVRLGFDKLWYGVGIGNQKE